MGLILARVKLGSHIIMEQTYVGESVWVPKRVETPATSEVGQLDAWRFHRFSLGLNPRIAPEDSKAPVVFLFLCFSCFNPRHHYRRSTRYPALSGCGGTRL